MSHYDCNRCGSYMCTDMNCSTPETLERKRLAREADEKKQRIRGAKHTLDTEIQRLRNIEAAKLILIAEGVELKPEWKEL